MDTTTAYADTRRRLVDAAIPIEHVALWDQVAPGSLASSDLVLATISSLCSSITLESFQNITIDSPELHTMCIRLAALEAVLSRGDAQTISHCTAHIFGQLEPAIDKMTSIALEKLLQPKCLSGACYFTEHMASLRSDSLRLPCLIFLRCVGAEQFTSRELVSLARGDLATAVAMAVAIFEGPVLPSLPQLDMRLWQVLHHLSTPQSAVEVLQQSDNTNTNDTPMHLLVAQHAEHAHRLALCLVQFRAFEVACRCAEHITQKASVLVSCLRMIHNLTASPHLVGPGRIIARQLAVLWPRFGLRLLAPHLRRLLVTADGSSKAALQAARELRRDLRTIGWVLHHSPELRKHAKPLCTELAIKTARACHPAETLAVALGAAANCGALHDRGALYNTLDGVDVNQKFEVCEKFPAETNRLWVIEESWSIIEDLGYWHKEEEKLPPSQSAESEIGYCSRALADIIKLQPWCGNEDLGFTFGFNFLDPEASEPYAGWDEDDEEWTYRQDWDSWVKVDWSSDDEPQEEPSLQVNGNGPLGWSGVELPSAPTTPSVPTRQLCQAPGAFRCAIDGRLCLDPVRTPEGVLYERASILEWLAWNKVCPITGSVLTIQDLIEDAGVSEGLGVWLSTWRAM